MTTNEIREMTVHDLKSKLNELKIKINELSVKVKGGDVALVNEKRSVKKDLARLNTVIKEKEVLEEISNKEETDA